MKEQSRFFKVLKTKNIQLAVGVVVAMGFSNHLNAQNTFYMDDAGGGVGGYDNCAIGAETMFGSTGHYNTAIGRAAMHSWTSGSYNCAVGAFVLAKTSGSHNVGIGDRALNSNTTGSGNVGNGDRALYLNTTGNGNSATGNNSLYSNTTGSYSTAIGERALYHSTGGYNTAAGHMALYSLVSGNQNCAYGNQALFWSSTCVKNTAIGFKSLFVNKTGTDNVACGWAALSFNTTGVGNTGLGSAADVSTGELSNATAIGYMSLVNASNKVRIGGANVTVVEGPVMYTYSDGRFKVNVNEQDVKGLEFIKKLRPVVYNLDTRKMTEFWTRNMPDSLRKQYMNQDFTASTNIRQSGFIAQEVENAAKEVNYTFNGVHVPENENDNYSISYSEFVVPLVKGMQEQQRMIEDQKQMIEKLQQQVSDLQKSKGSTTAINENLMAGAYMDQNMPNPFSRETVVKFNLPNQVGSAYMTVYDLSGKQIKMLPINQRGTSSITLTSDQLEAGIYIYSIMADGQLLDSKRMVVVGK